MRGTVVLGLMLALISPGSASADEFGSPYAEAESTCGVDGFPIPSSPCPRTGGSIGSTGSADGSADARTGALTVDARASGTLAIARATVADVWSGIRALIDPSTDGAVTVRLDDLAAGVHASCPSCPLRPTGLQGAGASLSVVVQVWRPSPGGPVLESETRCSIDDATPSSLFVPDGCPGADPLSVSAGTDRSVLVLLAARAIASGGGDARATATMTVSSITVP